MTCFRSQPEPKEMAMSIKTESQLLKWALLALTLAIFATIYPA